MKTVLAIALLMLGVPAVAYHSDYASCHELCPPDFEVVDQNSDGEILILEWIMAGLLSEWFIDADTNGDLKVSREEYEAWAQANPE
jgi:hypothetical protein